MKIAICDDDKDELIYISSILDKYIEERAVFMRYDTFHSATELLSSTKSGVYDLFILDVIMPGVNGMETAKEIRSFDQDTSIVFLTSSAEFAVESYQYKAQDYLLKPAKPEKLYQLLDTLVLKSKESQDILKVKTKTGMARIPFSKLAFLDVIGKCLYFHLTDGSVREAIAPLAEFENVLLSRSEFIQTHRSYIVNLLQVIQLTANEVTTVTGDLIPISRKNYSNVKAAYVEQLFQKKEEKDDNTNTFNF